MWGRDEQAAFERDGVVTLRGAFDAEAAARMSQAVWRYVESRTAIREDDPSTWPDTWLGVSFKKLKRHAAFRPVVDNPSTRSALDGIFGAGAWRPSKQGAQILFSFPDTAPEDWRVPSELWHMDASFHRTIRPPRAVKLFAVAERLPPRGGATMVLAGTPNLQAAYAEGLPPEERAGNKAMWRRFITRTDSWMAGFAEDRGEPDRNEVLAGAHEVNGQLVELRELGGEPGDVHVCHINLFHSGSPNSLDRPRMLITNLVAPVDGP